MGCFISFFFRAKFENDFYSKDRFRDKPFNPGKQGVMFKEWLVFIILKWNSLQCFFR